MTLTRAAEIGDFTGRTVEGRAYRYDYPSRVTDDGWRTPGYYEEMLKRCDTKSLTDHASFPVDQQHDRQTLGTVQFAQSTDERALMFTAEISRCPAGDKLLDEIESWMDVSVAFDALRTVQRSTPQHGTIIGRQEVRLNALSFAASGTGLNKGAEVLVLRAASNETPRLTAVRKRLILL